MREVISVHIGQAGCQIGTACWELYCLEHGIDLDGQMPTDKSVAGGGDDPFNSFFSETRDARHVPRAVFMDLEHTVVDQIRTSPMRGLFNPEQLLSGNEDAGGNYARGHMTVGAENVELALHRIRQEVEKCNGLQGFLLFHSLGGGTGSGFTALLAERLTADFGPWLRVTDFAVYPAPEVTSAPMEPYNAILAAHGALAKMDCTFLLDNAALFDICRRGLGVEQPTFVHLNRLAAHAVSAVTSSLRFPSAVNADLNELKISLVPYPRLHYPVLSCAPLASAGSADQEPGAGVAELTNACFEPAGQLLQCDTSKGKYTAIAVTYRGLRDAVDVNDVIAHVQAKRNLQFAGGHSAADFKVDLTYHSIAMLPDTALAPTKLFACAISNTTAVVEAWRRLAHKFDLMFEKRAFVHSFVAEGMELSEIVTAREDLAALEREYEEVSNA